MSYPKNDTEFRAAIRSMLKDLRAPAGKYRVCMWDDFEIYSCSYTFKEAMHPTVIGDHDDREEAIRIATSGAPNGWDDYRAYDENGHYLGGNRDAMEPDSDPVITDCRNWRGSKEDP